MTKNEIEQAIKNDESVWVLFNKHSYEYDDVKKIDWTKVEGVELWSNYFQYFDGEELCGYYYKLTFKTQAEAEHYLHHANITRTEQLPFLTWEEFLEKEAIHFIDNKGIHFVLRITDNKIKLMVFFTVGKTWDLTEENFYKAYDECVKLFKGE